MATTRARCPSSVPMRSVTRSLPDVRLSSLCGSDALRCQTRPRSDSGVRGSNRPSGELGDHGRDAVGGRLQGIVGEMRLPLGRKVLVPEFGSKRLGEIGRDQVAALHYRLHKTPSMANRVVETLSRLYYMAEAWGVAPEGSNPLT